MKYKKERLERLVFGQEKNKSLADALYGVKDAIILSSILRYRIHREEDASEVIDAMVELL